MSDQASCLLELAGLYLARRQPVALACAEACAGQQADRNTAIRRPARVGCHLPYAHHAGGDPYLQDLYRGASDAVAYCPRVQVHNAVGGVQLAGQAYVEPR
jgi:hypothetical protein